MRYVMTLVGEGEGCDYTIACNRDFRILEADSDEEALAVCHKQWEGLGGPVGYAGLESMQLFRVGEEIAVPLDEWDRAVSEEIRRQDAEREIEATRRRLAELESRR